MGTLQPHQEPASRLATPRHPPAFPMVRLSSEAEQRLVQGSWPDNLRQLDNIIRGAYTLALVQQGGARQELELREPHIQQALTYEGGNRVRWWRRCAKQRGRS